MNRAENRFLILQKRYNWRLIRGCPGRYVLRGGLSSLTPEELIGESVPVSGKSFKTAADPVCFCYFSGGGLISYRKTDGYIHTLCNTEGMKRKMNQLEKEKMMDIYLMQHGIARSAAEDPERALTVTGMEETVRISESLKNTLTGPLEIWHSGKKRSEQTADILAGILGLPGSLRKKDFLAPGDDAAPVFDKLKQRDVPILISGHLPFLSRLLARLLGLKEDQCPVVFRNSGLICLREEQDGFKIRWILDPDLL